MLFYFPAEIKLCDLRDAIEEWIRLLEVSPIDAVSLVQNSWLGWKGNDRYHLRSKVGTHLTLASTDTSIWRTSRSRSGRLGDQARGLRTMIRT
jgi:hypothetical protein